jgi:formate/nitrite transporter
MFPIGLVMIVLTGSDLFTSNIMFMTTVFLHRRIHIKDVLISWVVSYAGNLGGMLFFMAVIIGYGGVLTDIPAYKPETANFAIQKAQQPGWHQVFLRAIGANWLVCMAVFLSISAREIGSKILAIWFPTATFVALALDHVIVNMFFISIGIWNGAPFGVGYYIWKSLIPTTLGNTVGGGLFVGAIYWYLYLTGEGEVEVSFDFGGLASAMEAGGPMGRDRRFDGKRINGDGGVIMGVPNRQEEEELKIASPRKGGKMSGDHLPHSGGPLQSAVGRELAAEKYAKRKGSDKSEKTAV